MVFNHDERRLRGVAAQHAISPVLQKVRMSKGQQEGVGKSNGGSKQNVSGRGEELQTFDQAYQDSIERNKDVTWSWKIFERWCAKSKINETGAARYFSFETYTQEVNWTNGQISNKSV